MNIILWLLLALIWSSSYAAIKFGIETIEPMALVSGRMLVGTAIMLIILKLRSGSLSGKIGDWRTFFISGMTGNIIPFLLISYGETNVGSGLAAIFMGITPVATVLIAPLFLPDEKLTAASIAGICLGAAGLVILVGPGALSGIGDHVIGQISIIGAALCCAFTTIYVRKYATRPPLEMATGSMLTGTIVIVIATLVFESPVQFSQPSTSSFVALVYLGIFPTACATLIYFYLVPRLGASRMSQVNFFVPVAGVFIGFFLLGEPMNPSTGIALITIIIAIYFVTSKKRLLILP
jgi:drug/metabolite transporter (DMT)-like permease